MWYILSSSYDQSIMFPGCMVFGLLVHQDVKWSFHLSNLIVYPARGVKKDKGLNVVVFVRSYSSQSGLQSAMSSLGEILNRLLVVNSLLSRLFKSAQNKLLPHYRTACYGGYESWRSMNLCICNPGFYYSLYFHGSWFYKVPWFSQ